MSPSSFPSSSQNRCTHPRLHIRSAHEAHVLFEAVRLGLLPIVRKRLSPMDRELESGEVFVWEEASYKGGLERWTDGKKWSQSRMREPFLFYEEKAMPSREEREAKIARRACRSLGSPDTPPPIPSSPSSRRRDRPSKVKGLTKQTYSAYVTPENGNGLAKKWHLTAYFCSATYHQLPVVSDDPILANIIVPKGIYVTGKGLTRNQRRAGADTTPVLPPSPTHSSVVPAAPTDAQLVRYLSPVGPAAPSESSTTAPPTDDGSQSPWSMSSMDPLPVTPPLSSSPWQSGPSHPSQSSPSPAYPYHAPQPQYPPIRPHHMYDPIPRTASPMAYESNPCQAPRSQSYITSEARPLVPEEKPAVQAPHYYQPPALAPSVPPFSFSPQLPPRHQQFSEPAAYSPPQPAFHSGPPPANFRYAARHSLDQRALGAFRVSL